MRWIRHCWHLFLSYSSVELLISYSPSTTNILSLGITTFSSSSIQWAAVTTHFGEIREPAQLWRHLAPGIWQDVMNWLWLLDFSQVFCPMDIAILWKAFNRIRIIMGKFGCTQIQTSSSFSSERKKYFSKSVLGGLHILPRGLISLLTKTPKKIFRVFFYPKKDIIGQKMGL